MMILLRKIAFPNQGSGGTLNGNHVGWCLAYSHQGDGTYLQGRAAIPWLVEAKTSEKKIYEIMFEVHCAVVCFCQ